MKSLASKVKSLALASKPQVLENCPVLGSRTALFLESLKFCGCHEKIFEDLFFWRTLAPVSFVLGLGLKQSCPWPREGLSSEGLLFASASHFLCVLGLGLKPCVLNSTSGNRHLYSYVRLMMTNKFEICIHCSVYYCDKLLMRCHVVSMLRLVMLTQCG